MISYYPNGLFLKKGEENYPSEYLDFYQFTQLHKSDELKRRIYKLREFEYGSEEYKTEKRKLPCVLVNKFAHNLNSGFLEETYYKPFDVDFSNNTKEQVRAFRLAIEPVANIVVESPSGSIKFFLQVIFNTSNPKDYRAKYDEICDHLESIYDINLDRMQGNIKQPYFLTYQKEVNIKTGFFPFKFKTKSKILKTKNTITNRRTSDSSICRWADAPTI